MIRKLFFNARIYTPIDKGEPVCGEIDGNVVTYDPGAIVVENGVIKDVGHQDEIITKYHTSDFQQIIDVEKRVIIPGFVDPHTHMCFIGRREREFLMRLEGAEYIEILKAGGGILSTVKKIRESGFETLFKWTIEHVKRAIESGTTTVEIKSGYGLNLEKELLMLEVIAEVGHNLPIDVVATFLGAHAIPPEYSSNPDKYVEIVCDIMLPKVKEQKIAKFCDVFCEEGVFSIEQSRTILKKAKSLGLGLKLHADEIKDMGGALLAAELGATSADHLLSASDEGLKAMAESKVIAILLPATAFSLRKPFANARKMIELGVPIAIATDCNPGSSYCESMPFVFALAVLGMNLSVKEALVASTLNSAYAIGMANKVGSLERGKQADFVILEGESPAILAYHLGVNPVVAVFKRGEPAIEQKGIL